MLKTLQNIALYSSVFAAKKSILVKVFSQTEIKWKESNPEGSWPGGGGGTRRKIG